MDTETQITGILRLFCLGEYTAEGPCVKELLATYLSTYNLTTLDLLNRGGLPQRGPGAATKLDQPHRDREGICAITMPCIWSSTVATLTPCHKIGCKIVHSVQDFHN